METKAIAKIKIFTWKLVRDKIRTRSYLGLVSIVIALYAVHTRKTLITLSWNVNLINIFELRSLITTPLPTLLSFKRNYVTLNFQHVNFKYYQIYCIFFFDDWVILWIWANPFKIFLRRSNSVLVNTWRTLFFHNNE